MSGDIVYHTRFMEIIDGFKLEIVDIGKKLFIRPEVSGEEKYAHDLLTDFLRDEGFKVTRNFHLANAFCAEYENSLENESESENKDGVTPHVGYICEYDALPDIGHGAAKHLITVCSLAAALSVKQYVLEEKIKAKITIFGCPREEAGVGKIDMMRNDSFKGVHCLMLAIPHNLDRDMPLTCAQISIKVNYIGRCAHAAASPWEGRNALDAAVACYNNISLLRQHLRPSQRVSGIITQGGAIPSVVPGKTELLFSLRAADLPELYMLKQKCASCFVAAAKATACEVAYEIDDPQIAPIRQNTVLGELYAKHGTSMGMGFHCVHGVSSPGHSSATSRKVSTAVDAQQNLGSNENRKDNPALLCCPEGGGYIGTTDLGNVSVVQPCLMSTFYIGKPVSKNSEQFATASNKDLAYDKAIRAGCVMGLVAAEIVLDPSNMLSALETSFKHQEISERLGNKLLDSLSLNK